MPQEKIEENYRLLAWKGSADDIADIFERVHRLVGVAEPESGNGFRSVSVETPNREITFDTVSEFREWVAKEGLNDARKLRGSASEIALTGLRAWVTIERRFGELGGIHLHVAGEDPVAVSGIASQLRREIDRGKRSRLSAFRLRLVALTVTALATAWTVLAVTALDSTPGAVLGVSLWLGAMGVNAFADDIVWRLVPAVEVLETRESLTILDRWRGKLLAAAGVLAAAIVAAVIQAVLS
jgi:hypothetical protein